MDDEHYMREALALAREAERKAEVPVGAVIVKDGHIVGEGDFSGQGGEVGGCGVPGYSLAGPEVVAVALNLVAANSTGPGNLVAWPADREQPFASVINYQGTNVANQIILPLAHGVRVPVQHRMRYVSALNAEQISTLREQPEGLALAREPEDYSKKFRYNQRREQRLLEEAGGVIRPMLELTEAEKANVRAALAGCGLKLANNDAVVSKSSAA